jgi:hypothetical protein
MEETWLYCLFAILTLAAVMWIWQKREPNEIRTYNNTLIALKKSQSWEELAGMYITGLPSHNIKPNHAQAILALQQVASTSPKAAYTLANLLERGFDDVKADSESALQWYNFIRQNFPNDEKYRSKAISRINTLAPPPPAPKVKTTVVFFADPVLNLNVSQAPRIRILSPEERIRIEERDRRRAQRRLENIRRTHFWIQPVPQPQQSLDFDRATNDQQNIHNTSVASTVANSVKNLLQSTELLIPTSEVLWKVRCLIKPTAYEVLDAMESNFVEIDRIGMTEVKVLELVYNRIMSDKFDDESKKSLLDNLSKAFDDCIENDKPVCVGGRIARLVDVLNILDDQVKIQPAWAIRDEMLSKASKLRERMYNELPVELQQKVDSNTPESDLFHVELKDVITRQLHSDYVSTGILSLDRLNIELEQWIDHI